MEQPLPEMAPAATVSLIKSECGRFYSLSVVGKVMASYLDGVLVINKQISIFSDVV